MNSTLLVDLLILHTLNKSPVISIILIETLDEAFSPFIFTEISQMIHEKWEEKWMNIYIGEHIS